MASDLSIGYEDVEETISGGKTGEIESGVFETFAQLGIKEPKTAPEKLAIMLAKRLDSGVEDKSLAGVCLRLTQVLEDVRNQPKSTGDFLTDLQNRS